LNDCLDFWHHILNSDI